jgi:hypothetical protein
MSLYQYTPYSPRGQSSGEAFQSGFAGSQAIETNAMRMDEMRQLAQMRELQEQRAQEAGLRQAAEAKRTAQMFPLQLQQAEFNLEQARRLGPIAVQRAQFDLDRLRRALRTSRLRALLLAVTFGRLVLPRQRRLPRLLLPLLRHRLPRTRPPISSPSRLPRLPLPLLRLLRLRLPPLLRPGREPQPISLTSTWIAALLASACRALPSWQAQL